MAISKEVLEYARKQQQEREEKNIVEYPAEHEIYQEVMDHLINEIEMIEDGELYTGESIINRLKDKKDSKE